MFIKELPVHDYDAYRDLVGSEGNVFNTLEWLRIYENIKIFGIYENSKLLIGGFSFASRRVFNFRVFQNPPFTPYIGPFFRRQSSSRSKKNNEIKRILSGVAEFFRSSKNALTYLAFSPDIIDFQPFLWEKFHVSPNYTYILDLSKTEQELFDAMSSERRNDIRKAIHDGLRCEFVTDQNQVKHLILKTFQRNKKTIPVRFIDKILFQYAKPDNSYSIVTFNDGKPVAGCFCVYDSCTSYYLMSGYDDGNKHHGAGALALWHAIQHAKSLNLKRFDFEGSMIKPIEKYFRGFGGELAPYFRISRANFGLEVILKIKYRTYF